MIEDKDWPKVYILILNWNGWKDTIECLESLRGIAYPNYEIVVVDNGSTDDSVEKIKTWAREKHPSLVLMANEKNLGYAGGNNVGLRYILKQNNFDYVWILNNDTVVHPDALTYLVKRMKEKPKAGLCGSAVLHYADRKRIWALGGIYDKWFAQGFHLEGDKLYDPNKVEEYKKLERKMNYVVGASVLVSRPFLLDVGLMCEDYFLFFEELDWATRAKGRYCLAIAPQSIVYHKGGESIKKQEDKPGAIFYRYTTRNRLLFTSRFYPYALPVLYLSILGYIIDRLRVGETENASIIWEELMRHFCSVLKI